MQQTQYTMKRIHFIAIALLILGAFTRVIPHWPNFTAIGAVALLGGMWTKNQGWTVITPLLALFISDLILNNVVYAAYNDGFQFFYDGAAYVYGAFFITMIIGQFALKSWNSGRYALLSVITTVLFFLVTNFGTWINGTMYTQDFAGLMNSYLAGLPFAVNQLLGTLVYGFVMQYALMYTAKTVKA